MKASNSGNINSDEVNICITKGLTWPKLPQNVKQQLGNRQEDYDKAILNYSVRNQLRYRGHLVQKVFKGEKEYYEELVQYSREHLMLYPYHLQEILVKGLRLTPFRYYLNLLEDLMSTDRSYDSLPNFTACDCLRLCGIGRNQYIDLMNQCRCSGWLAAVNSTSSTAIQPKRMTFLRGMVSGDSGSNSGGGNSASSPPSTALSPKQLLPKKPISACIIEPWWLVHIGSVMIEEVEQCTPDEQVLIDTLIDEGPKIAGKLDYQILRTLHLRGLIYLDVPIEDGDHVCVPTLEGFVMNRVLGDYFETLLYKIFVSLDENISVRELAEILQIDLDLVKNAISVFCRLGFAYKKEENSSTTTTVAVDQLHSSWNSVSYRAKTMPFASPISQRKEESSFTTTTSDCDDNSQITTTRQQQPQQHCLGKLAFLFDSTLTAFLMMGNLSAGLKNHAVTMFEVGKLSEEALDSFLDELDRVSDVGDGEAKRYYDHAVNLRHTLRFLRSWCREHGGAGIDLLRSESVLGLDAATRLRILRKNYSLIISMAPITNEDRILSCVHPPLLGPILPEINSPWFKLFIYSELSNGPPTLFLAKWTRLNRLPICFFGYSKLLITTWRHDPVSIPISNALVAINEFLLHNPVLIQAYEPFSTNFARNYIAFPTFEENPLSAANNQENKFNSNNNFIIKKLEEKFNLQKTCGYVTVLTTNNNHHQQQQPPVLLDLHFGIPLFDQDLTQQVYLGISQNNILSKDNLNELIRVNRSLAMRLLHFIDIWNGNDGGHHVPTEEEVENALKSASVAQPRRNFIFYDGKLQDYA